jgi:type I restriction enzyme M protein
LEVLGLERCVQFLRPGGRLGIVLPEGIVANRNARYVREWLESQCKIRAIVSLPVETFTPFGANIKTSILFARKWRKNESKKDYSIFLSRVDNVGYDATGRKREGEELTKVADELIAFINREGW